MAKFYSEIAEHFVCGLRDDIIDAIEAACITEQEWRENPDDCVTRVYAALEELTDFDLGDDDDYGYDHVDEAQEWYDFGERYSDEY